jgi:hypothetical protein
MFELWKLRWHRYKYNASFDKKISRIPLDQPDAEDILRDLHSQKFTQQDAIDTEIDVLLGDALIQEAKRLDIEVPHIKGSVFDDPLWEENAFSGRPFLGSLGRFELRRKIDEEKTRRFEVKTLWVIKIIIPVVASLVGVIGAITGLVAVLQHKK